GKKLVYLPWQQLHDHLRGSLLGLTNRRSPVVAMQYSPGAAIPYLSRLDAGTAELIRSLGAEIVTSADLVNRFESAWSDDQLASHETAAAALYQIVHDAFDELGRRLRGSKPITEYDIQQFIVERFNEPGLIPRDPPIVAVNANSALPHYEPTSEVHSSIHENDFVLIDLLAKTTS